MGILKIILEIPRGNIKNDVLYESLIWSLSPRPSKQDFFHLMPVSFSYFYLFVFLDKLLFDECWNGSINIVPTIKKPCIRIFCEFERCSGNRLH